MHFRPTVLYTVTVPMHEKYAARRGYDRRRRLFVDLYAERTRRKISERLYGRAPLASHPRLPGWRGKI